MAAREDWEQTLLYYTVTSRAIFSFIFSVVTNLLPWTSKEAGLTGLQNDISKICNPRLRRNKPIRQ